METQIRRYFTFRKPTAKVLPSNYTTDELDLVSIPYEATPRGRAPVHSSVTRNTEPARTKDDLDIMELQSFPYESFVPGVPPIIGANPIRGNGPVKLQTSRRLSSGELLVTTQDQLRTLSDIRDGEYIIGRKDPNRVSKTISLKLSLNSRPSTPRPSSGHASQGLRPNLGQTMKPDRKARSKHVPDQLVMLKQPDAVQIPSPHAPTQTPRVGSPSKPKEYMVGPAETPLPLTPGRPPSSRTSLLSRGEEQNATIQALWKAEYARLVAIYGQDGVDRNIAELNKDRFSNLPEQRLSLEASARKANVMFGGLPSPSTLMTIAPSFRSPRGSFTRELPFADTGSEYSSVKVPSVLSSEESSSSYTKRTSLFENDIPTTREEVSRIVENMRKTYLKAFESTAAQKPKAKRAKKPKQRTSYPHTKGAAASAPPNSSKAGRQSWHPTTNPETSNQERSTRKGASSQAKIPRDSATVIMKATPSMSSLKMKPQLHRADSTTLGSFFGSRKEGRNSPSPAQTLKASKADRSPETGQPEDPQSPTHVSKSSESSLDNNIGPDVDDFDIFYQDLALDFSPVPSNVKPAIPAMYVPYDDDGKMPHDAAPPPPNIDSTPRKHSAITAL